MTVDSPEQAVALLDRAEEFLGWQRDNEAYELLEGVEQSGLVPEAQRPRLLFLLGEACYRGQSYDAALFYFDQCAATGDPTFAPRAQERIAELRRADEAVAATEGGVESATEAAQLAAAADEAYGRGDYQMAFDLYRQAYGYLGPGDVDTERLLVGMGRTLFALRRFEEARQHLEWCQGDEGRRLLEQLNQYEEAMRATADGVQGREAASTWSAACDAYERGDVEGAARLFDAFLGSARVPGEVQAAAWYNLGLCHLRMGNDERAVECFEVPARAGWSDAQEMIDRIRAGDRAMESVGLDLVRTQPE